MTLSNDDIIELTRSHVAPTYARFPVAFIEGSGARLIDADGKSYLDFISGLAVCNLGHCHPRVVEAIRDQAGRLLHTSNFFHIAPQAELARLLCENSFAGKAFFANSGAEANEAAMKLARKYFSDKGEPRYQVISMEKSFHGRTMAAMAATGQSKVREGFEPLLEKFVYVPFGDYGAVKEVISDKTAAILVEPIQGEGGVNLPPEDYLKELRALCDEKGTLLIFDEVQTGMGRTGKLFAYEHYGVEPDIMTLAKGLAGGVAIGAMLAKDTVAASFGPGSHASTFGGNFLSTAAACAAIRATLEEEVLDNTRAMGEYLVDRLNELKDEFSFVNEVRGKGLIIAMELSVPGKSFVEESLKEGLIINCTGESILRFLPPLIITRADVDEMISILRRVFEEAA